MHFNYKSAFYFGLVAIVSIPSVYLGYFYFKLGYKISSDTAVWGALGDYFGGVLNPILSFISIILLISSLTLQREANIDLRKEIKTNEKSEKFRSFETHFFNMINSQNKSFDAFSLVFKKISLRRKVEGLKMHGVSAIMKIEDDVQDLMDSNFKKDKVVTYLELLDEEFDIYNIIRIFYVIVKITNDSLSDDNGFNEETRKKQLNLHLNFTDFSYLRLIMICMEFMDYPPLTYLIQNKEFNDVLFDVGLSYDGYLSCAED